MFPDAFVETGEVGWFGKEKPHWEGICRRIVSHEN
jgi:hypothetical protein